MWPAALDRLVFAYVLLVGACLGSFVNVVIARLPHEQSLWRPRSNCPNCKTPIAWYDNIPLVSYAVLRGRCRACGQGIAVRYWLVEAMVTGLCAALFVRFGISWDLFVWVFLAAALVAIIFLDIDHWWVPDVITYPCMVLVVATCMLPGRPGPQATAMGLAPAALLWLLGYGFGKVLGKEGIGFGDVKLLATLGLAVGAADVLMVLFLAALQGAVVGSIVIYCGGHQGSTGAHTPAALAEDADWHPDPHAVPFGPFLALAAFEVVLLPDVFGGWHHMLRMWAQGLL